MTVLNRSLREHFAKELLEEYSTDPYDKNGELSLNEFTLLISPKIQNIWWSFI